MRDVPAPALPGDEAAAIARQLEAAGRTLSLSVPADAGEAWERVAEEANRAARALARMGAYLLWLRAQASAGEFDAGLVAHDVAPAQARTAMRVARLVLGLAGSQPATPPRRAAAAKLLALDGPRLNELARLDPEEVAVAHEQGELDLDDVASMSTRMLRDEVRRLRAGRESLKSRVAHWQGETHRLQAATGAAPAGREHPAPVVRARSEGAALADQAMAATAALRHQATALLESPELGRGAARHQALTAGARPLVLHAGAVAAEAAAVYEEVRAMCAAYLPERWSAQHQPAPLTVEEARVLAEWRRAHVRAMDRDAEHREAERITAGTIRRGRGRPRKTRRAA